MKLFMRNLIFCYFTIQRVRKEGEMNLKKNNKMITLKNLFV